MLRKFSAAFAVFLVILTVAIGAAVGFFGYLAAIAPTDNEVYVSGDLQIHFLELGNKYTGDSTYIKAGDVDILIDAGSRSSSIATITNYINQYVTDGKLEYVIVTHAHQDHYAGFATNENSDSIFDLYEVGTIIDFALTNQKDSSTMYKNYQRERAEAIERGATHYSAAEIVQQNKNEIELGDGVLMTILDSRFYYETTNDENDYSVCTLFSYGDDHFLLTGDLEKDGEKHLVEMNDLPKVKVYKAGHHGSKTSSTTALLEVIQPEIVCVTCCAGSEEYTKTEANKFPTQDFIDRIAPYTDKVYVTTLCIDYSESLFEPMNGNIIVIASLNGVILEFTGGDGKLKDSEWFKAKRQTPEAWK